MTANDNREFDAELVALAIYVVNNYVYNNPPELKYMLELATEYFNHRPIEHQQVRNAILRMVIKVKNVA